MKGFWEGFEKRAELGQFHKWHDKFHEGQYGSSSKGAKKYLKAPKSAQEAYSKKYQAHIQGDKPHPGEFGKEASKVGKRANT